MLKASKRGRNALALAAAFAVGLAGLAGASAANAETIDPARTGTITIHKHENPGWADPLNVDGSQSAPATAKPLNGVVFEYCPINLGGDSLTDGTNAAWDKLNAVTPAQLKAAGAVGAAAVGALSLGACTSLPATANGGIATSGSLPVGAYFVREVSAPSGVVKAVPFIVTVPSRVKATDGAETPWVYDVHVYPKNTVQNQPTKNVVDQDDKNGVVTGDQVDFEISNRVPALEAGQKYTTLVVTDTIDNRLDPVTTSGAMKIVRGSTTLALTKGTDYFVKWEGRKVSIWLTTVGLGKIQAGDYIVTSFSTIANANGEIENTAYVNVNNLHIDADKRPEPENPDDPEDPPSPPTPGVPTNKVVTRWGPLEVTKVDSKNPALPLAGAEFELYMSNKKSGTECAADDIADTALFTPVKNKSAADGRFVTDNNGKLIGLPGLWVGDTEYEVDENGVLTALDEEVTEPVIHNLTSRCYVLVEKKAPIGYVLPDGSSAKTAVEIKAGTTNDTPVLVSVKNVKQDVPDLPLTGGTTQLLILLGGAAVLAIVIGGTISVRRRKEELVAAE